MIAEDEKYKGTWRHLRRKGMKRAISTLRGGVKDKAKVRSTLRDGVKDKAKVRSTLRDGLKGQGKGEEHTQR